MKCVLTVAEEVGSDNGMSQNNSCVLNSDVVSVVNI